MNRSYVLATIAIAVIGAAMSVGNAIQGDAVWAVLWAGSAGLNGHRAWSASRKGGAA